MRIGLISDTHGQLRPEVFRVFEGVDRILHAGDIGPEDILTELATIAPVDAVIGNTDGWDLRAALPEQRILELEGRTIALLHGHVLGSPTPIALRRLHPRADVIVYGHTHVQKVDEGMPLVVNPGAAGPARFKLKPSVAILTLSDAGEEVQLFDLR